MNAFNAHRNGSHIKRVCANIKELHGAVAFELSKVPEKREAWLKKHIFQPDGSIDSEKKPAGCMQLKKS